MASLPTDVLLAEVEETNTIPQNLKPQAPNVGSPVRVWRRGVGLGSECIWNRHGAWREGRRAVFNLHNFEFYCTVLWTGCSQVLGVGDELRLGC